MVDMEANHGNALRSLNQLLNWYLNESACSGQGQSWFVSDLVPNHIREFVSLIRSGGSRIPEQVVLDFNPISSTPWYADNAWFSDSIDELTNIWWSNNGSELFGPCILHGSMGSGDFSLGWSDFDIFALVPDTTVEDPALLLSLRHKTRRIRELLQRRAPLQHHGIQFVTADSLDWFDEASLPVAAIRRGKTLGPSADRLPIRPVFEKQTSLRLLNYRIQLFEQAVLQGELRHHAYKGVYLQSAYRNGGNGLYQLKYLLDVCTLAPAIAMAAAGSPCDKGSAIARLSNELAQSEWKLVQAATEVRNQWPRYEGLAYTGNEIPYWIREIVGPNYFEQARCLYVACLRFASEHGAG